MCWTACSGAGANRPSLERCHDSRRAGTPALGAEPRAGLVRAGVGKGDRVAALLPNCPEALVALLATASLGAVWSSCAPEFGVDSVLDRFGQIAPKVLLGVDGYSYGGRAFDRTAALA